MIQLISKFEFGNITANYILNESNRAVLVLTPKTMPLDINNEKNRRTWNNGSLVHLKLSEHDTGIFANSHRCSDTLLMLTFSKQEVQEDEKCITVITEELAADQYGIRHYLKWVRGQKGLEAATEFFNNSGRTLTLEYLTSVSLDAISPFLPNEGSKDLVFHRFKAGWSMEGLLQSNDLCELGMEQAWNTAGECIKLGAIGSRPVRDYHPYGAIEDRKNGVTWGMYLAHNASWQMELSRLEESVALSIGLADNLFGMWSKQVKSGETFLSPKAMVGVVLGGIADLSNDLLSMRHPAIDAYGEEGMGIAYNEYATTWGNPTEKGLLEIADILKQGSVKYFVMDDGWFTPRGAVGDWEVNRTAFPNGMKKYTDEIRKRGMIPGIWMEFECIRIEAEHFAKEYDPMKLTCNGRVLVGRVCNGNRESFFDFRNPEALEYLNEKVIQFLKENGFGYIKVDYNASIGVGIDGPDSPGENLRAHMELVRRFFARMKKEIPELVIENCASGGCRLEPSMMDISAMSSCSDTHDVYEAAVVGANLHYLIPPRQSQIWATIRPDFSRERMSYVISQGFLGRLCWSGSITELSQAQLQEMFRAEEYYEKVAPIIKHGNSYIYRTDKVSFHMPTGTQAVIRYSEDMRSALLVVHHFDKAQPMEINMKGQYEIDSSLYPDGASVIGDVLTIPAGKNFSGSVYLLTRK